jgi:hypothetical protein
VCRDAADYMLPDSAAVLFFYHPFQAAVMQKVLRNIQASLLRSPRDLWLIYYNPVLRELVSECSFLRLIAEGSAFVIYRSVTCEKVM